jgi:hypothetical protein
LLKIQEETSLQTNYMKDAGPTTLDSIDSNDRDHSVLRIIDLCQIKGYRDETLFLAIRIFDRIFATVFKSIDCDFLPLFIVTCTILAAKMEQPMTPSIQRMISLLSKSE